MTSKMMRAALLTNGAFAVFFNSCVVFAQATPAPSSPLPLTAPSSALDNSPSRSDVMIIPVPKSAPALPDTREGVMIIPAPPPGSAPAAASPTVMVVPAAQVAAALAKPELPAGFIIEMTPVKIISTKKLKVGDSIELEVLSDIVQGGKIFIQKGAKGFAVVDEAVGSRIFGKGGQMTMSFQKLQLSSGLTVDLSGQHSETGARGNTGLAQQIGQSGAGLAGLGGSFGAVGALAGLFAAAALKGSAAKIKPGAILKARTANMLTIGNDGLVSVAMAATDAVPAAISLPVNPALQLLHPSLLRLRFPQMYL